MKRFCFKLLNLYPGEGLSVFQFILLSFIWALAATFALEYGEALFLLKVGAESLPKIYILIPCGMLILSTLLLYAFHHSTRLRIFQIVTTIGIICFSFVYFTIQSPTFSNKKWLYYLIWFSAQIFFNVGLTALWTFMDQFHKEKDSRRIFSLYSAMIFLGQATSGSVMRLGVLKIHQIFFIIISLLIFVLYWMYKIAKNTPLAPIDTDDDNIIHSEHALPDPTTFSIKQLIKTIFSSRYTLLIVIGNFLTFLLWHVCEFNFLSAFQNHFNSPVTEGMGLESAELTLFIGQWIAIVSIANLIFALFIYSRLVNRFGFGNILLYTPILFLIAFGGWIVNGSLLFPMIGFFIVEGSLLVIDDTNFSLLLKKIPSQKLKCNMRVIVESFFEPIGQLTSGIILSLGHFNSLPLGLGLSICLFIVAMIMRQLYFKPQPTNITG